MIQKSLNGKIMLTVRAAGCGGGTFTSTALKYKLKVLAFYLSIDNLRTFILLLHYISEANIVLFIPLHLSDSFCEHLLLRFEFFISKFVI